MNSKSTQDRPGPGRFAAAKVCFGALLLLGVMGCEHRISLDEFLEMQQETEQATTQPAPRFQVQIDKELGPYKVGPSDVLSVSVIGTTLEDTIPPVQVRVHRDGAIELPMVGKVKVADMELEDVENAIRKAYVETIFPRAVVHVQLVSAEPTTVLVTGAVAAPGLVQLRRTERNLLYAIVAAGGVSSTASGRVTLCRIRQSGKKVTLNVTDPEELKEALALAPLKNGDILTVEAATPNTIFVGGLVNAPSPQPYPQGVKVTVLQAIAAAGGLRTDVLPREATLIRNMPGRGDVHVKLDMNRIQKGKDPNIALAAGDILWVPHTFETRVQEWISRNIYVRGGVSADVTYNFIHSKDILKETDGTGTSLLIGNTGGATAP